MDRENYHHGDLRTALLDAAERLVARQGAGGASLRAIAREAGVSPAAPYHHFEDRESLLAAVAASGFRTLGRAMVDAFGACSPEEGPLEPLRAAGIAYVRFAVENPEVFRLMFGGLLSDRSRYPELEEAAALTWTALERLLGSSSGPLDTGSGSGPGDERQVTGGEGPEVTDEGSGPPDPMAEAPVALAVWSTVHGLAFLLVEGLLRDEEAAADVEMITRQVTGVLGRGLRSYTSDATD